MTSLPLAQNRLRRRIVVVVVVLLLTALFISWSVGSSGVDQRFVGKWDAGEGEYWNFDPDGKVRITGERNFEYQRWWVRGNRMVFYTPSGSKFADATRWLGYTVERLRGNTTYNLTFEDYPITKFTGDTMQLDYGLDLKRVSEPAKP